MYIEFELAQNDQMMPALVAYRADNTINQALATWSKRHHIPYKTKRVKYRKRVTFDSDESYSLFALTWNTERKYSALDKWRIVFDLNNKI
jgi:hypothetical protein